MGCCKTNPCSSNSVCASGNLEPAFVNRDDLRSAYGATGRPSSISSVRPTIASLSATGRSSTFSEPTTTTTTTTAATATRDAAAATITPKDRPPVAAIAGGAAGGALALAAVVGLLIYYFCHAKKSRKGHEESASRPQSNAPHTMTTDNKEDPLPSPGRKFSYHPSLHNITETTHSTAQLHIAQSQQLLLFTCRPVPSLRPSTPDTTTPDTTTPIRF
jgi:hypothetical protein